MDFLGTPGVDALTFVGLDGRVAGHVLSRRFHRRGRGVSLLGVMAMAMPPAVLLPVHTVVMLGSGVTRTMIMWRDVIRGTVLPFRRRRDDRRGGWRQRVRGACRSPCCC